ncbi:hypothetical protein [Bradyrhizobium sp. Leo170]|uniref:hypothetical protein n=1 Tax=Bradyrhizobium sp. Leo170 TaxID=1571199 RepID=UPI00102E47A3|nr:hypothetical protein [Bradyrhizobium sp. Leo170]TAI65692.1 hypothetical protein CWO89_12175 [Bradyrhizobium sp. Leo170]
MLPIHPAAELFPRMTQDELKVLGEDIKKNGLRNPIAIWTCPHGNRFLLDGRNRADAMEMVGLDVIDGKDGYLTFEMVEGDPYAYAVSANIHRRHLTAEQRRGLIAKLLKATPEKSNRQIAEAVKASHVTVGTVRAGLESTGQIDQLTKTVGKDGKARQSPERQAHWHHERGEAKRTYPDLMAVYRVEETAGRRKNKPKYLASVLTETGPLGFNKTFSSMEAAKRFCENDARNWQRKQKEPHKDPADVTAADDAKPVTVSKPPTEAVVATADQVAAKPERRDVVIDSGPIEAEDLLRHVPREKWHELMLARRRFCEIKLSYDCRCLMQFISEAELMYAELGFASPDDMVRDGYALSAAEIDIVKEWLRLNSPEQPIEPQAKPPSSAPVTPPAQDPLGDIPEFLRRRAT